ncbi:DUF4163 domain-containing protein [Novosphingobium huizhouense]|uniref:DUF4163 domain-containing protein n=1 Tax=Novosphingobium huizhouense TaxID=2866625 RepID=UPI001CD88B35|nr:DUF4163 domain-containing protein [Novosphingobium huizhouense]
MKATFACPALLLVLAACGQGAPTSGAPSPGASAAAAPEPSAPPAPPPAAPAATARSVKQANDLYQFAYAYPAAAAAIPALKAQLDADLAKQQAELARETAAARADAKANDYPYHPYESSTEWKVVTDLPGWLSLSTLLGSYSGGAHSNYAYDAILWDKQAGRRVPAIELFTSKAALKAAITRPFCAALDRARRQKRGADWKPGGDISEFDSCIDPLEQVLILGSAGGKGFDRIGFLIAPYNAGPFAEGSYEVTLPVTPAVLVAVKPAYRAAFVAQ